MPEAAYAHNAATALAMQARSVQVVRTEAGSTVWRPQAFEYGPLSEPNMPTAPWGPSAFSASFHFAAMRSKAWSQLTGTNSAVLVVLAVLLTSGCGQAVAAVHDLDRK